VFLELRETLKVIAVVHQFPRIGNQSLLLKADQKPTDELTSGSGTSKMGLLGLKSGSGAGAKEFFNSLKVFSVTE